MEIIKVVKGENREGLDKYYISVQNKRFKEYMVSITVDDGKVTNVVGTCMFWVWEISRNIKTNKICRHAKKAISYLKEKGVINE